MRRMRFPALVAVLLALAPTGLAGQVQDTLSVRDVLAAFHQGHTSVAGRFLAQELGPRSARALDELADSLVAIATSFQPDDASPFEATMAASTLGTASLPFRSVPDTGAFERLIRVYHEAPDVGIRGGALRSLVKLPGVGRALDFIEEVAASSENTAFIAVRILADRTGPAGLQRLRRMFEAHAVVQPGAAWTLDRIAEYHGWKP